MKPLPIRRPKPWWLKPRTGIIAAVVVLIGIVGVVVTYNIDLQPVGNGETVAFEVKLGQTAPTVAASLKTAGLIRSRNAFITYLNFHGLRGKLKAGTFSIAPSYNVAKIANILTSTTTTLDQMVIPEGYTITQIEAAAAKHGIATPDFQAALTAVERTDSLTDKPAGTTMEGYLFPDSYTVTPGVTTASILVGEMVGDFVTKVGTTYDAAFAAEGLTRHQGLTLASIVEREVSRPEDRPLVAQVFLKRLKLGMPLGSDVTIDYGAALLGAQFSTSLNSPYNTYLHTGLPPTPICNPGLSALDAVAHPAATDYLYFVAGSDGVTHFASTYAEHQANVAKYLK